MIAEEALKNKRGHWFEYNRAIVAEARRRGIDTTVLAHRDVEPDVAQELGATPFFAVTNWDGIYNSPSAWKRYLGILRHNLRVARAMGQFFAAQPAYDVVLVPTVVLHHWIAWRWLAWRGHGRWFRKLVLTTRNNAGEYDAATGSYRFKASAAVLRRAIGSFRGPVRRGEVELASDSDRIAAQHEALCRLPFAVYPHPVDDPRPPRRSAREPGAAVTFGALGPPRHEKGSDLVLEAIRMVRDSGESQPRFVLQWSGECDDGRGRPVFPSEDLRRDPGITVLTSDLTTAQYQAILEECDTLLLPYRRAQYHARLSGVAIEAFRRGIPCICFSDTWIAGAMERWGGGIAVAEESAEALAGAIRQMLSRYGHFASLASARAPQAMRVHSPANFLDQLLRPTTNVA